MYKLKTLKDLPCIRDDEYSCCNEDKQKHYSGFCGDLDDGPWTKDSDLRELAIKWIKAFDNGECHTDFAADGRDGQGNICEWIQHVFNITEEDLKC